MISFKKNSTTKGTIKNIVVSDGLFIDDETGEVIELAKILASVYGDSSFDISTTQKFDSDVEVDEG